MILGRDDDSYGQRLLLAVLPITLVALIPATVAVWKEIRAGKAKKEDKAKKPPIEKSEKTENSK